MLKFALVLAMLSLSHVARAEEPFDKSTFPWDNKNKTWKDPDDLADPSGNLSRWRDLGIKLPDKIIIDPISPNWSRKIAESCSEDYKHATRISSRWIQFLHEKRSALGGPILDDRVIYLDARIRNWMGEQLYKINHLALQKEPYAMENCKGQANKIISTVEHQIWTLYELSCAKDYLNKLCLRE